MKALAGVLLAVGLAMGIGSEANAQSCPLAKHSAKHVTKSSVKKKNVCACRLVKTKKATGVIKTRTYAGYVPGGDTVVTNREAQGLLWQSALEPPARDPILNGGTLNGRMDGRGGLEPRTITNGMENTMSGSR